MSLYLGATMKEKVCSSMFQASLRLAGSYAHEMVVQVASGRGVGADSRSDAAQDTAICHGDTKTHYGQTSGIGVC